ncbi:MAG TPA: serine hydrolase [Thermoanaerobaculia bacterium]|nr:serine hydrolase [Thermoanaerobaculia bacterium]
MSERRLGALALATLLAGCGGPPAGNPMEQILRSDDRLEDLLPEAPRFRLQAVLGLIEPPRPESPDRRAVLVQHGFRLEEEYFYPASTVKLFAAVAALELLAELAASTGLPLGPDTRLVYHPLFEGEQLESWDETNLEGGAITVRHEIRKLFLVSDNHAFNRLYELVGQDGLAASLAHAGLGEARIVHRLGEPRSAEENRRSPRIDFLGAGGGVLHSLPERTSSELPSRPGMPGLTVGRAHLTDAGQVDSPMDFSGKNRLGLADLQRGLCRVVRPDVDCGGPGFRLTNADRELLLPAMSQYPGDSANPRYDRTAYPDEHVKYLLPGLEKVIPKNRLRIYNKVGQAYGFTTENAWVVGEGTGASFFLAATIYTNEDGVVNDDRYEYRETALPFFAALGEATAKWVWGKAPRR